MNIIADIGGDRVYYEEDREPYEAADKEAVEKEPCEKATAV